MTQKEVSELFAVWALNWPNSEMFKGGAAMLDARVKLYASQLADVDYWLGQKATEHSLRTRIYAPNIAEFLEDIETAKAGIESEIDAAYVALRSSCQIAHLNGRKVDDSILRTMPSRIQKTVTAMGGIDAFAPSDKPCFEMTAFKNTYLTLMRTNPPLLQTNRKEIT